MWWSRNFRHFDRLFYRHDPLVGIGAQIAQFRMQAGAVVERQDVLGHVVRGLGVVGVVTLPHALQFQIQEEAKMSAIRQSAYKVKHFVGDWLRPLRKKAVKKQ